MAQKNTIAEQINTDPDNLIRRYVLVSIVSIVIVLLLTCYGIYRVSFAFVIDTAEDNAVSLANSLTHHVIDRLLEHTVDGSGELRVTAATFPRFDANMRDDLEHFKVLKVKLFDRYSRLIYSSDGQQVGRLDQDNRRLANSLSGHNDSLAVKKDKVLDFNGQQRFTVDVVETYVPVRNNQGKVIGSFELYQDVTLYYRKIIPFVAVSGVIMLIILIAGFRVSHVLLKKEALQLKAAQEELKKQASTDFLTGICNRRQLLERCVEEMSRLKRMEVSGITPPILGFIMIDIDHFKQVNDQHGHAAGDEVIRELAERLKQGTRSYDIVGRYGGEEFLVVVSQAEMGDLKIVAERLWSSVRSTPFQFDGTSIAVTISLGVATSSSKDEHHEDIIMRADEALYRAKNEGRDRICYSLSQE
jgi:diguanylate cyclase (GGDEF)-like protein